MNQKLHRKSVYKIYVTLPWLWHLDFGILIRANHVSFISMFYLVNLFINKITQHNGRRIDMRQEQLLEWYWQRKAEIPYILESNPH